MDFGPAVARRCDDALAGAIEEIYGPIDRARLHAVRAADRVAPFRRGYRENDLGEITSALVRELTGSEPSPDQLDVLLAVRHGSLVECLTVETGVAATLERLGRSFAIGVLSNYPSGRTLRASLRRNELESVLDAVVVSGDVGFAKPHPVPFRAILDALGVGPADAVMIGDNWLADVQGAKRLGMRAVHFRRWTSIEGFERGPEDAAPDATIRGLDQLEEFLAGR